MMSDEHNPAFRNLDQLGQDQLDALRALKVFPEQEEMDGSFQDSMNDWRQRVGEALIGFGLFLDAAPIGIVLFKRPPVAPHWVAKNAASMHGLKIALPWQGKGLGHIAFAKAVECLQRHWPDIDHMMLAVDAEKTKALSVYRAGGLTDSGPIFRGRVGLDHRMKMSMTAAERTDLEDQP